MSILPLPDDKNSTTRRKFLATGASAALAATATTAKAAEPSRPDRRPFERPKFWVAARDSGWDGDETGTARTIEGVIASHVETYRGCEADSVKYGETAAQHRARIEDFAIWDGSRLVAVLQVMPDGTVKVTRFDGKIPSGPGPRMADEG